MRLALTLALLFCAGAVRAGDDFLPPDPTMVNALSCSIVQTGRQTWTTWAVAKYLNHDSFQRDPWKVKLSEQTGKNGEIKANRDCKRWMDAVRRAQDEFLKQKEKEKHK